MTRQASGAVALRVLALMLAAAAATTAASKCIDRPVCEVCSCSTQTNYFEPSFGVSCSLAKLPCASRWKAKTGIITM